MSLQAFRVGLMMLPTRQQSANLLQQLPLIRMVMTDSERYIMGEEAVAAPVTGADIADVDVVEDIEEIGEMATAVVVEEVSVAVAAASLPLRRCLGPG